MDMTNEIMEVALHYISKSLDKDLEQDAFYELAKDGFSIGCDEYAKAHPYITDEDDEECGEMWYDTLLDDGILDSIMCKMLELGFTMKDE